MTELPLTPLTLDNFSCHQAMFKDVLYEEMIQALMHDVSGSFGNIYNMMEILLQQDKRDEHIKVYTYDVLRMARTRINLYNYLFSREERTCDEIFSLCGDYIKMLCPTLKGGERGAFEKMIGKKEGIFFYKDSLVLCKSGRLIISFLLFLLSFKEELSCLSIHYSDGRARIFFDFPGFHGVLQDYFNDDLSSLSRWERKKYIHLMFFVKLCYENSHHLIIDKMVNGVYVCKF